MRGFTAVQLIGNLVRDPSVKYLASGLAMAETSAAVNTRKKVDGEWRDEVHYFDVAFFGNTAETVAKHLKKGAAVFISGRLVQSRWETQGGEKRQRVSIIGDDVRFIGARQGDGKEADKGTGGQGGGVPDGVAAAFPGAESVGEEEIPF